MIFMIILGILLIGYLLALLFDIDVFTPVIRLVKVMWFLGFRLLLLYIIFVGVQDLIANQITQGLIEIGIGCYCFYLSVREVDWSEVWSK